MSRKPPANKKKPVSALPALSTKPEIPPVENRAAPDNDGREKTVRETAVESVEGESSETVETTETETAEVVAPPSDAAGWREFFRSIPTKDLLRILQQDKGRSSKILVGFRPTGESVRHPMVLQRLVDEVMKHAKFAEAIWEARPAPPLELPAKSVPPLKTASVGPTVEIAEKGEKSDENAPAALRETLKKQRAALKEKEARLAELEARLSAVAKERDAARAEIEIARAAQRHAETEAERHRRQRERDTRREAQEQAAKAAAPKTVTVAAAPIVSAAPTPRPFEEAVRRLLIRGQYSTVAEVCREALLTEAASSSGVRGTVHALYAGALYAQSDPNAEEQDRLAVTALLDGGQIAAAAEAMARLFSQARAMKSGDTALLRRLLLLAERMGEATAVKDIFKRMSIGSAEAARRLYQVRAASGKNAGTLLDTLEARDGITLSPDEAVALPVVHSAASSVTARRIVRAIDTGDGAFIAAVRQGLEKLRTRGGSEKQLAEALAETVAAIDSVAVCPLFIEQNQTVLVDASNVARHEPDPLALTPVPKVTNLLLMREHLLRQGFFPVLLIADANLRFHVDDREGYKTLIDRHIVRETPPGMSADEELLREARSLHAPLVSNDRFSEWGEAAFGTERVGFLITAGRVSLMKG